MKLRLVSTAELPAFVASKHYQQATQVPITPLRAISQSNNPRAEADDVVLVIAEDAAGQLLSYIGCLPDRLAAAPDTKVCWCSCWWSDSELGQSAAIPVFHKMLELWEGKMLFDALPPHSIAILERLKFVDFIPMKGRQYNLRFKLAQALPNRFAGFANFRGPLRLTDQLLNFFQDRRLSQHQDRSVELQLMDLSSMDEATQQFIHQHNQKELIGRQAGDLKWILQHPWVDEREKGEGPFSEKYFFTAHAEQYFSCLLQVRKGAQIIAVLLLTCRDGVVRSPYVYFDEPFNQLLAEVVLQLLVEWKANAFICFHSQLNEALQQTSFAFLHQKEITKVFGIPKQLAVHLENHPHIQDGDGDVAFT
ncbi:MAG: hypothetical protein AAF985_00110 [Bacteroidota bacterium]